MNIEHEGSYQGAYGRSYRKFGLVPGYSGQRDRGSRWQPAHKRMKAKRVLKRRQQRKCARKQNQRNRN